MRLPKFRQYSPDSAGQWRALAKVDESALAQAQKALKAITERGAVKNLDGKTIAVRASDARALLEGRRFRFVESEAHYVSTRGVVVEDAFVKASAEVWVAGGQGRVTRLNQALSSGELTLDEWTVGMQSAVRDVQIGQAALAHGKLTGLPPPVTDRIEARVLEQFNGNSKFPGLRAFAQDIARGRYGTAQPSPALASRALQYPAASRAAYENEFAQAKADAGFDEICRILANAKHCDSCAEEAAKGFVPSSEARPIGDDDCATCKCTQVFRRSGQGMGANVQAAIDRAQQQVEIMRQIKAERLNTNES